MEELGGLVGELIGSSIWIIVMIFAHCNMVKKNKGGKIYGDGSVTAYSLFVFAGCSGLVNICAAADAVPAALVWGIMGGTAETFTAVYPIAVVMAGILISASLGMWGIAYHIYANYRSPNLLGWGLVALILRIFVSVGQIEADPERTIQSGLLLATAGIGIGISLAAFFIAYHYLGKKMSARLDKEGPHALCVEHDHGTKLVPVDPTPALHLPLAEHHHKRICWRKALPLIGCGVGLVILVAGCVLSYRFGYARGEEEATALLAAEYEPQLTEQFDAGFDKGYSSGLKYGLEEGYESGQAVSYDDGYDAGYYDGYSKGLADGFKNGHIAGFETGAECMIEELKKGAENIEVSAWWDGVNINWEYSYD